MAKPEAAPRSQVSDRYRRVHLAADASTFDADAARGEAATKSLLFIIGVIVGVLLSVACGWRP